MILIHSMDSGEELQIQTYDEPDAFAASSSDMRSSGIKMTPEVPPQFDGQSSWFEHEDLIDDPEGSPDMHVSLHHLEVDYNSAVFAHL